MSKEMKIKWVPIESVKKNPRNPRAISERKMEELMRSIKEFPKMLEYRPIIADRKTGYIVGGNQRHAACLLLGWTEIPVAYIDDMDDKKIREFMLKDNMQFGEWDFTKLKEFYSQEQLLTWGLEDAKYVSFFDNFDEAKHTTDEPGDPDTGVSTKADPQDQYDKNVIKKIVFNLSAEEYDEAVAKLAEFNRSHGFEDNTQALLLLLDLHKRHEAGV